MHSPCSLARTNGGPSVSRFISARQICWQRYLSATVTALATVMTTHRRVTAARRHANTTNHIHSRIIACNLIIWC